MLHTQITPIVRNATYYRHGLKFYYFLKANDHSNSLLQSEIIDHDDIILAIDAPSKSNPNSKNYTLIKGHKLVDFFTLYLTVIPEEEHNFYEIIHHSPQKPHFDIDCDLTQDTMYLVHDADLALNLLTDAIHQVLSEFHVASQMQLPYNPDTQLLVYDSHGSDKRSYHVIINGVSHANKQEAKGFYDRIMSLIIGKYNPLVNIDSAVYGDNQAFRLIGSTKLNKGRYKRLRSDLSGKNITSDCHFDDFYANFVSFTHGCVQLPSFVTSGYYNTQNKQYNSRILNGVEEDAIMNVFSNWDISLKGRHGPKYYPSAKMSTYYKRAISSPDGIISLFRIKPGKCPCHPHTATDPHKGVGAFLTVDWNNNVYFHCHSTSHGKAPGLWIGQINSTPLLTDEGTHNINTDSAVSIPSINEDDEDNEDAGFMFGDYYVPPPNKGNNNTTNYDKSDSSQVLTQQSSAAAINLYTNEVQLSAAAKQQFLANKDNLVYFIRNHTTSALGEEIKLYEFIQKYQDYLTVNGLILNYKSDVNRLISRDISSINPYMGTRRKQTKGLQYQAIVGYKFINLEFMNTKLDIQPIVDPCRMTSLIQSTVTPASVAHNNWTEKYAGYSYRKLRGPHLLDNNERIPDINIITGNAPQYLQILKSVCGSGKTELISAVLETADSFLNVSGRISLVNKQLEDYKHIPGYKSYNDDDLKNKQTIRGEKKLGITIDSLYKPVGKYEYLILDEYSYTQDQLVRFAHKKDRNVDALIERIKVTPKVIVADAFIEDTTLSVLRKIRPDIVVYENNYPKHSDKTVSVVTEDKSIIYHMILTDINNRINIMIPIGSLEDAEALVAYIQQKSQSTIKVYRGLEEPTSTEINFYKIKIYSGNDRPDGDPVREWLKYNAIIYTSVIQAGNSFTERHFSRTYGIFTPRSFGPQSSAQMILRSRTTQEIILYVQPGGVSKYPDYIRTPADLRKYIANEMRSGRMDTPEGIKMSYVDGTIDLDHPYTDMYVDVEYREMIGKRYYLPKLLQLLKSQGMRFGNEINVDNYINRLKIDKKSFKTLSKNIKGNIKVIKDTKRWNACVSVSKKPDITHIEAGILQAKAVRTPEDEEMLEKYNIKMRYHLETVTPSDIWTYRDKRVKDSYTNVLLCKELSGVMDEATKIEKMKEVASLMEAIEYPAVSINTIGCQYIDNSNIINPISIIKNLQNTLASVSIDDDELLDLYRRLNYTLTNVKDNINITNMNKIRYLLEQLQETLTGLTYDHVWVLNVQEININRLLNLLNDVIITPLPKVSSINNKSQDEPHITNRIGVTYKMKKYKRIMHSINILRIYGFNEWLRTPEWVSRNNLGGGIPYPIMRITAAEFKRKTKEVYDYMKFIKNNKDTTFDKLPDKIGRAHV